MRNVVVLDAGFQFVEFISERRAIVLVIAGRASVLKEAEASGYRTSSGLLIKTPLCIQIPSIKMFRKYYQKRVAFTANNLFLRDGYTCAYCGKKLLLEQCTIDHIIPRAKGGGLNFENCVTACQKCNVKKGCRTPQKAKMPIAYCKPVAPTIQEFYNKLMADIQAAYDKYRTVACVIDEINNKVEKTIIGDWSSIKE